MLVRQLGSAIEINTPAKLNLFLEVLFRRDDGFHEIETLMTSISIFDTIYFSTQEDRQLRITCDWSCGSDARFVGHGAANAQRGDLPVGADNLVLMAVERLRQRAGEERGASIRLVKRIPSAAGLGGASSDAAAGLVAANRAWALGWSRRQLAEVAAEIGSDVPYFLGHGAAICRGRGELIEPLAHVAKLHFVVARPPEGLSTPQVYRHCVVPAMPERVASLAEAFAAGRTAELGRRLLNRLQEPAEGISPWIGRIRRMFDRLDCCGHQMSGSGSSYFGICRNAQHARRAAAILRAQGLSLAFPVTTFAAEP